MTRPQLALDGRSDVLLIHEEQLATYGGAIVIRDVGLLESAVAMPRASAGGELAHEDLFAMSAAYAFHVAQNQAFVDGNKRTGWVSIVFLDPHGNGAPESPSSIPGASTYTPRPARPSSIAPS